MKWTKDVKCGAARQEKRKISKETHGCNEGGDAEGQGEVEAVDLCDFSSVSVDINMYFCVLKKCFVLTSS